MAIAQPASSSLQRTLPLLIVMALGICSSGCRSYGLAVESVDDYSLRNGPSLPNSVASGDGFVRGMTIPGSPWELKHQWTDRDVWDGDFTDSDLARAGQDNLYFDQPGVAISYFTGHGIITHGCALTTGPNSQPCTTTTACTNPVPGSRLPGTCRFSPFDMPARCCYMVDRMAATAGNSDFNSGLVNYTAGPIRWGESPQSGGWAGAGTNGGTNLVVLDISHGILPTFWFQTMQNASAGVHMIATLMTAGGDTNNSAIRGATFARMWAANPSGSVSQAWLDTMSSMPTSDGQPCGTLGGGRGFNGCGCHIVIAMDNSSQAALSKLNEDWIDLRDDKRDAKGNQVNWVRWQCNYTLTSTGPAAWELP